MTGEPIITITGNLTGDPELRFTPSGAAVANFTVASTPRTFNRQTNSWDDGQTLFMRCSVWRDMAEHVAESLTKGMRVVVTGRLTANSYETKEGEKRTTMDLQVDEVGPSLRYATAKVTKTERSQAGQQQSQQAPWGGQQPQADPWATNMAPTGQQPPASGPQGQQQGGWGQSPQQSPQQGPPQGQQGGGWGNAPSYDEPPF